MRLVIRLLGLELLDLDVTTTEGEQGDVTTQLVGFVTPEAEE